MAMTGLLLSQLLPAVLGIVWWRRLCPPAGGWPLLLGYGYLLGMVATTLIMRAVDLAGLDQSFALIGAIVVLLSVLGLWLFRDRPFGFPPPAFRSFRPRWRLSGLFYVLLLLVLLLRVTDLALELVLKPLFPWDAWVVWAAKARVWLEWGRLVPFGAPADWLAAESPLYTLGGWHYPATVPLITLWAGLGLGHWDDAWLNLPWLLCFIALGLGFYGQLRVWGASSLFALVATYLLLSLPLFNAHVALAGYADLWMSICYSFAALALVQWVRDRDPGQGIAALLLAVAGVTVKVEGLVWLLSLLPVLLVAVLPRRLLPVLLLIVPAVVWWWYSGGLVREIPGWGVLRLTPEVLEAPYLGRFPLTTDPTWAPLVDNFLVLANWHLLWYLVPAVLVLALWCRPKVLLERAPLVAGTAVLMGLLILGILFLFTQVSVWAKDYTAVNRLFMQMVPVLIFYLAILVDGIVRPVAGRAPPPVGRPG